MSNWMICPACDGEGTCVNPSIDSNGLTASDFHEDPDLMADYLGGLFDQSCEACNGSGKITGERYSELQQNAENRKLAAMENGDYESFQGAGDFRWG